MSSPHLNFDNSYARLPGAFYTKLTPTPPSGPLGFHLNQALASLVGIDPNADDLRDYLGGYKMFDGADPLAAVYAGHQFGAFVPRLGDGRAILLGEVMGTDQQRCDLLLKGAGKTPYSRMGDGRAVLRSSLREYVVGEYLHALGVPTTRALSLVVASERVQREVSEPSATIIRTAPSHVRFGSFEYFHYSGQYDYVRLLADYAIGLFWPQLAGRNDGYLQWYFDIMRRTAELMALWQVYGFVHGVMNTDNMSLLGLTLDFGPYGFIEEYTPDYVFNHTDQNGRYAFDKQAEIGLWNLRALGHSLSSLLSFEMVTEVLAHYGPVFATTYYKTIARRFGIGNTTQADRTKIDEFLAHAQHHKLDYTHAFLALGKTLGAELPFSIQTNLGALSQDFWHWHQQKTQALGQPQALALWQQHNPLFVPRTQVLNDVIAAVAGDEWGMLDDLLASCQNPFSFNPQHPEWYAPYPTPLPQGCLSCSS